MMLVAIAVAALVSAGAPEVPAADTLDTVFKGYCEIPPAHSHPYCATPALPESVKWLTLYSLCSTLEPDKKPSTETKTDAKKGEAQTAKEQKAPEKQESIYTSVCDKFRDNIVASDATVHNFLTYNPRTDRWAAAVFSRPAQNRPAVLTPDDCKETSLDSSKWYCRNAKTDWLDISETGLATVTRAASDDIPILIVGVNPLLYGTTPVVVTSDDIENLAALQEIALGLGNVLQGATGVIAELLSNPSTSFTWQLSGKPVIVVKAPPAALTVLTEERDRYLRAMADASADLSVAAAAMEVARSQALVSIQEAEQAMGAARTGLTVRVRPVASAATTYEELRAAYDKLEENYTKVRDFGKDCRPLYRDFRYIIEHSDMSPRTVTDAINAFKNKYDDIKGCAVDEKLAALAKKMRDDLEELLKSADVSAKLKKLNENYNTGLKLVIDPPEAIIEAASGASNSTPSANPPSAGSAPNAASGGTASGAPASGSKPATGSKEVKTGNSGTEQQQQAQKPTAPLDAALELLTTKRNTALATHNALVTAGMRREAYCFRDTVMMMTWLYVEPKTDQLPWSKVQTHTLHLKRNAPLSGEVTPSLGDDTELTYKLQSNKTAAFGVGLGVIYTKLSQPKYDAVTSPENKDEKVVSQVDTETLAGQLGLFADWRFLSLFGRAPERWFLRPSLQVGTNVSETPGFFTGVGIDLFKYFRFGWGRTWQQSKRLSPTQTPDKTVVSSASDIKTEDFFAKGNYVSFTFALDSLPLFKKSDSAAGSETKTEEKTAGAEGGGGEAAAAGAGKNKPKTGGEP